MRLHAPEFERKLRHGSKQAIRDSKELKREFRQANKYKRQISGKPMGRLILSFLVCLAVWAWVSETDHLRTGLAALALWTSWFAMIRALALGGLVGGSKDIQALFLLPISDRDILQWEFQKYVRSSLWSLLDIAGGLVVMALALPLAGWQLAALLPLGVICWAVQHAIAVFCAVRCRWLPPVVLALSFIVWIISMCLDKFVLLRAATMDQHAENLLLLLPTGWSLALLDLLDLKLRWWLLVLLVPAGFLIWSLWHSFTEAMAQFKFEELPASQFSDIPPDEDFEVGQKMWKTSASETSERVLRIAPSEVEEIIRSRRFLRPHEYRAPHWFEMALARWMTPRECVLAEFTFPEGWRVTMPWLKVFRNLSIALLLSLGLKFADLSAARWVFIAGLAFTGLRGLGLAYSTGRAGQFVTCSAVNIPLHAVHPLGLREAARLLFKCTLVQLPAIMLYAVGALMVLCSLKGLGAVTGLLFGLKATVIVLAGRFVHVTFVFSSGTNDTSDVRLRSLALFSPMILGGLLMLGLSVAGFLVPSQWLAWGFLAAVTGVAYGLFRFYGWLYHANRFDLMTMPKQT